MKWEYKQMVLMGPGVQEHLNSIGADGWELVSGQWLPIERSKLFEFFAIFKRPKAERAEYQTSPAMEEYATNVGKGGFGYAEHMRKEKEAGHALSDSGDHAEEGVRHEGADRSGDARGAG